MIWTILILVIAIAMFLFGANVLGNTGKGETLTQKCINLVAIILVAGCMVRLVTPYYLTTVNPMILQEMANGYQEQQAAEKNKAIRKAVKSGAEAMMADAPILGNVDAKNTIFIWTDFSCPYCRRVHGELEKVLKENPGKVPFMVLTVTNNTVGGQPVSMKNIRETAELCHKYGVPVNMDSARFAEAPLAAALPRRRFPLPPPNSFGWKYSAAGQTCPRFFGCVQPNFSCPLQCSTRWHRPRRKSQSGNPRFGQ